MKKQTVADKVATRSDRIAIEPQLHEFYKKLSEGADPEEVPFAELKEVFLMAVCLGYKRGKRRPLSTGRRDIIRWETFSKDTDIPLLFSLAMAATGDVGIIDDGYEFLTIAEEYANEGIHVLGDAISNQRGRPLWNLIDLVRRETGKSS